MSKKILIGFGIIFLVLLVAVSMIISKQSVKSSSTENKRLLSSEEVKVSETNTVTETTPTSTEVKSTLISPEELSKHKTESDCWISYDNRVYDITTFLPKHKGSAKAISPYCGTSTGFQEAFEAKHGKTKVSLLMKVGTFIGDFKVVGNL